MDLFALFLEYFEAARPWLGGAFCLLGGVLTLIGTVGVLRFPDFYTRLHAASVTDTSAVTALLLGMALLPETGGLGVIKLLAIWIFMFLAGPTATHAVGNAAYIAGLQPLIGKVGAGENKGSD